MERQVIVFQEKGSARLDKFLTHKLEGISRTKLKELIERGKVKVNEQPKRSSYKLKWGDVISVIVEKQEEGILKPYPKEIKIIYEDEDVLLVDKPSGLTVHPPQRGYVETLVNALVYMEKRLSDVNPLRPGVVHRLDKDTSGVMVLAKNNKSHLNLLKQFRERVVEKRYWAIVWGVVREEKFTIELPLRRDTNNPLKMKVSFVESKFASTEVEVVEKFSDSTFLSIKPITGRMHQIRAHLKFVGYPVVGDKKYGVKDAYPQLFLHSYRLGFNHPTTGKFLIFQSPLPLRFYDFIESRVKGDFSGARVYV